MHVGGGLYQLVRKNANSHQKICRLPIRTNWHPIRADCACFYAPIAFAFLLTVLDRSSESLLGGMDDLLAVRARA